MKKAIRKYSLALVTGTCVIATPVSYANDVGKPSDAQIEFFEKKIRPTLVENCYVCHSEHHKEAGGLRVDDYKAITNSGRNGQAVLPGNSAKSILIQRVTHPDDSKTMPPDHRLSESQIADLKAWIDDGAAWPPLVIPKGLDQTLEPGAVPNSELQQSHWAWQPLQNVTTPELTAGSFGSTWAKTDVDKFVVSKLEANKLTPVDDASKSVLLRRLTYDLTGLPPTQEEVYSFLLDESPKAIENVVDKLLASTAFGERWGRHWLDVARYGESTGSARNLPYPHAWRYRDYVIDSFNQDKPFDKFIQEQLAGDLLPASSLGEKREQLTATGFLAIGVKDVNQRFKVRYDMDNVDEQIDTVSRSLLGLTVGCARCHDHKFDPIASRDYYALAGIFASTELCDSLRNQMGGAGLAYYVPARLIALSDKVSTESDVDLQQKIEAKKAEFEAARTTFTGIRDSVKQKDRGEEHAKKLQQARQAMQRKQAELVALTDPAKSGPVALGVRDAKTVGDTEIRIRGEAEKLGPIVPRGFLSLLDKTPAKPIEEGRSGRYELAKWITDKSNPLTPRVAVNRVWQHLFADGLVRTVDNFGSTGDLPSHPELLDFLANKFIEDGWSVKKLIRYLVLTRSYQLSSGSHEQAIALDPANRLLWRHSPRRLEAEEIRDTVLAVAGKLDRKRPEGSAAKDLPVIEIRNNGAEAKELLTAAGQSTVRSVYLPLVRGIVPNSLEVFDFAEQGLVTGKRTNTTVAPQALFLLNDTFVRKNALVFAESLRTKDESLDQQVTKAYRLVLHRQPTSDEIKKATGFVQDYATQYASLKTTKPTDAPQLVVADASSESAAAAKAISPANASASAPANAVANQGVQAGALVAAAAPEDSRDVEFKVENLGGDLEPKSPEEAALTALVHSLFSSAEFRYIR